MTAARWKTSSSRITCVFGLSPDSYLPDAPEDLEYTFEVLAKVYPGSPATRSEPAYGGEIDVLEARLLGYDDRPKEESRRIEAWFIALIATNDSLRDAVDLAVGEAWADREERRGYDG
jgi:hypothetical protein